MEVHSILHSLSHTHKPTLFLYLPFSWSRAPTQACLAWQTVESSRVEPIHRHIHRMHCVQKKKHKNKCIYCVVIPEPNAVKILT